MVPRKCLAGARLFTYESVHCPKSWDEERAVKLRVLRRTRNHFELIACHAPLQNLPSLVPLFDCPIRGMVSRGLLLFKWPAAQTVLKTRLPAGAGPPDRLLQSQGEYLRTNVHRFPHRSPRGNRPRRSPDPTARRDPNAR